MASAFADLYSEDIGVTAMYRRMVKYERGEGKK